MNLFYWQSPSGNFGDDLNRWYWDRFLSGWQSWDEDCTLVGVGSILNTRILPDSARYLVLGSGSGFGDLPDVSDRSKWDVRFVRGPLTARNLGLDASVTDPAALISRLPNFTASDRRGTAYIPHCHSDASRLYDWGRICNDAGLTHISPRGDSETVIRAISRSERVITESMHGAILADAFRVPWIAVSQLETFNYFKWKDWGASLMLEIEIIPLPAAKTRRRKHALFSAKGIYDIMRWKEPKTIPHEPNGKEIDGVRRELDKSLRDLCRRRFNLSNPRVLAGRLDNMERIFAETRSIYGKGRQN
jgi:succinoglycan biosynthesis protein ExoV